MVAAIVGLRASAPTYEKPAFAADGLSKVLPVHVSRYYLWNISDKKNSPKTAFSSFQKLKSSLVILNNNIREFS